MYQLEDGRYEIVLVPDVNNAQVVNRKAISTQQVYLSSKEQENRDFAGYVRRVFEADCNIEELTESTVPLDTPAGLTGRQPSGYRQMKNPHGFFFRFRVPSFLRNFNKNVSVKSRTSV